MGCKNFDLPKIELPLSFAVPPNQVAIAPAFQHDFGCRIVVPEIRAARDLNKNFWEIQNTVWEVYPTSAVRIRGSAGGPFRPLARSRALGGQLLHRSTHLRDIA